MILLQGKVGFLQFLLGKIKAINNANLFLQPSLIILTRVANNSDHKCIWQKKKLKILFTLYLLHIAVFQQHRAYFNKPPKITALSRVIIVLSHM